MLKQKRYSFWKIFWVVLGLYLVFALLGVIALYISPVASKMNWGRFINVRFWISQCFSVLFSSAFYYFSMNKYYQLIAEKKPTMAYVPPTAIGLLALGVYNFINMTLSNQQKFEELMKNEKTGEMTIGLLVFSFILSSIFFTGISLLIAYLTNLRDEKKQRKILEEQKMQLEIEKSQANLNFLKAQINPHFLHNTLNFLYAKSLPYSPELSEGILTLSDIMRYALSEGNTRDGKAPLKDEIEHVRNVIKINQLRFSNNLNVRFDVNGVVNGYTIIPFVLITLVENAFKHGDLKSAEHPIEIRLSVENGRLQFFCRNKKKTGPKEISTGVGLDNIQKRLDQAYGKDYSLHITDESEFYTTELTIRRL